jgi:cytochrome c556
MKVFTKSLLMAIVVTLPAGAAFSAGEFDWSVKARKAEMTLRAFNIGQLGAMANGKMEYNADAAKAAAHNLKVLTTLNGMAMWPKGSDNVALGDKTNALPALWENFPKVIEATKALSAAADVMADAAGKDLASLQGAIGAVGKACASCHGQFRKKMN